MLKVVGVLIIVNSLALTAVWISSYQYRHSVMFLCVLAVLAGIAVVGHERFTEFTVAGFGTVKAAAAQATEDAGAIREVRQRVEAQSATIDLVAQAATRAAELSESAAERTAEAESRLEELATATVFTSTVIRAQNDGREAFDQLGSWANDNDHPFAVEARAAYGTVMDLHAPMMVPGNFTINWNEGVVPEELELSTLLGDYVRAPGHAKPALIKFIWERDDIPEEERLRFLVDVIRTDESLTAVEYAGRYLNGALGLNFKPLAVEQLLDAFQRRDQDDVG